MSRAGSNHPIGNCYRNAGSNLSIIRSYLSEVNHWPMNSGVVLLLSDLTLHLTVQC